MSSNGSDGDDSDSVDDTDSSRPPSRVVTPGSVILLLLPAAALAAFLFRAAGVQPGLTTNATLVAFLTVIIAVVFAFVFQVFADGSPTLRRARTIIALSATVVLTAGTITWPWPFSDDNVDSYLRKQEVVIGVRDDLPGWMVKPTTAQGELTGFDGKLVNFLEQQYGFKAKIVVLSQNQRIGALTGDPSVPQVDLVIDVFSMTQSRMSTIDMAGPYFVDRALAYQNEAFPKIAPRKAGAPPQTVKACTVGTTTASPILESHRTELQNHGFGLEVTPMNNINDCLNQFKQGAYSLTVTDWSIIRAFDPTMPLDELGGKPIANNDPGPGSYNNAQDVLDHPDSPIQLYGIGLRNNHPNVCRDLTKTLVNFLSNDWGDAFKDLNAAGVTVASGGALGEIAPNWHKPQLQDLTAVSCDKP